MPTAPGNNPAVRPDRWLHVLSALGLLLIFAYRMGAAVVDPDLWHQMAFFREYVNTGAFPYRDPFAYTETVPLIHHEWGAGVIAYGLTEWFGGAGILTARLMLAASMVLFVIGGARLRGADSCTLFLLAPLGILLIDRGFSTIRAQLYSFGLVALLLLFLEYDKRGRRFWIPLWLVLYVAWVNVHAGFVLGFGIVFLWWIEQGWKGRPHWRLAGVGGLMILLAFVNPYGIDYVTYLGKALLMPRPRIMEWQSLYEGRLVLQLAILFLSALLAGYGAYVRGIKNADGLPLLMLLLLASWRSNRLLCFYAIVWTQFVPGWIQSSPLGEAFTRAYANFRAFLLVFWSMVVALFVIWLIPLQPWKLQVPGSPRPAWGPHAVYPVGAVDYLSAHHAEGCLLIPFDWGAYAMWKLYPRVKVSLDSRYEAVYPESVAEEQYRLFMGYPEWRTLLPKYARDYILTPVQIPLRRILLEEPGWKVVYQDAFWFLFARDDLPLPVELHPDRTYDGRFP
ncbi:MAG: hypothetical protein ACE15F_10945 [bacterium]